MILFILKKSFLNQGSGWCFLWLPFNLLGSGSLGRVPIQLAVWYHGGQGRQQWQQQTLLLQIHTVLQSVAEGVSCVGTEIWDLKCKGPIVQISSVLGWNGLDLIVLKTETVSDVKLWPDDISRQRWYSLLILISRIFVVKRNQTHDSDFL